MTIHAIIQARMGSTRLPAKIMKELNGRTLLGHVIGRVAACSRLDGIVVATTVAGADDVVAAEAERFRATVVRGSEQDVLSRFQLAAQTSGADLIVRVTSDCPLFDGQLLDQMLAAFQRQSEAGRSWDYLSNTLRRTYPRGLDAEVFTAAALARADREAIQPYEREHVTPYLYQHPELFQLHSFEGEVDWSDLRWTVDTAEDFAFVRAVYAALEAQKRPVTTREVLKLLQEQPELKKMNAHVEQKKLP